MVEVAYAKTPNLTTCRPNTGSGGYNDNSHAECCKYKTVIVQELRIVELLLRECQTCL